MLSRRNVLARIQKGATTHAGLWLDKFLTAQTTGEREDAAVAGTGAKAEIIRAVEGCKAPAEYREAYTRLRDGFNEEPTRVLSATAKVEGRMVIGLGAKGALEAGLHLDHTWGVPIIPGSALKGLAAATAHHLLEDAGWKKGDKNTKREKVSFDVLFGTTDDAGGVIFHDAWWIPEPADARIPIHLDVMTVHHPSYYQPGAAGGVLAPSDMDSPTPIAFASVSGSYLVAVEGDPAWCDAAMEILKIGLAELGIGAKTNAGYGRMALEYESPDALQQRLAKEKAQLVEQERVAAAATQEQEARRQAELVRGLEAVLKRIGKNNASSEIPAGLAASSGELRAAFASRVVKQLTIKWFLEPSRKDLPWVIELLSAAGHAR